VAQLKKSGIDISAVLSVYPNAESPLIVFNQAAKAEQYCLENVLPKMKWSVKGLIKRGLFLLGSGHPSVSSFILISGSTNKFQQVNSMLCESELVAKQDLLCITTSNAVFLSFSIATVPDYVVHHAKSGDFELRQELHQVLTALVSTPITKIRKGEQEYFVESGLPGKPWFQLLNDKTISMGNIKQRALSTLNDFTYQVAKSSDWSDSIDVVAEFTRQFEQTHKIRHFDKTIVYACSKLIDSLPKNSVLQGSWQHGDYCINNLLFAEKQTYIIDFEEFGDTLMPLQDIFSLALSLHIQREIQSLALLDEDLKYCLKNIDQKLIKFMPMLFVYHLIFRLGEWGENPNRTVICEWLQNILIKYINSPNVLFSDLLGD